MKDITFKALTFILLITLLAVYGGRVLSLTGDSSDGGDLSFLGIVLLIPAIPLSWIASKTVARYIVNVLFRKS